MLNQIHRNSMEQSKHFKNHRPNRSSPALAIHNGSSQHLNHNGYHQTPVPTPLPLLSSIQCSAYFIARVDLNNYTLQTLKQTVDSVVSGPKSKGLKVKLSLPDEGLLIDNMPDPNQSWMYKTSELLYFWRDSYYVNIIVIVTLNRSYYQKTGPYSASIFRLRGNESVQLFLQRAQQFFAQLSGFNTTRNNTKISIEKSATAENVIIHNNNKSHRKRSKHRSRSNKQIVNNNSPSSKPTVVHQTTRTEFDPEKPTSTNSFFDLYHRRTYSDTPISSDTRISNSKKQNNNNDDDDDDKMTTVSNYLPGDCVAELMRELKELRNEIAALKSEARFTPVRSSSTSPLFISEENLNQRRSSSQSETDAEIQTGLTLINDKKPQLYEKNKRKNEQLDNKVNKLPLLNGSNNIKSNREEMTLVNSSQINGSSNEISSSFIQEDFPSTSYSSKSRSILKTHQNGSTTLNSNSLEKDSPSISIDKNSSLPIKTGEVVSFRSLLENTINSPENIYENVPIVIQPNLNQNFSPNNNDQQNGKPYLYVTITADRDAELQKQYLSQFSGAQNGMSSFIPPDSLRNNSNTVSSRTQETTSNNQQYFPQVLFSDHLTNPLFNVDKQLLTNTIANQFGIDRNSPYLQKLIANQHLFVTHKRTFANMIWQMTPEEENALYSSPPTTNIIDINTVDSNSSTAKSILKSNNSSRSVSKGQRISWDSALE